ncbi:MAG TPA: YraN family protein [Candidatus Thioglobus sp.]|jgi:putative endonuclease|nr:YraN family protein [Candidatus Thioglobus sp.]HIL21253.1 YraN family protein [Candidatus Thioglobus sp.]
MFSFKRRIGNKAEALALDHLKQQGLSLIEQNYLTKLGEIDIIMLDKITDTLVFVEVRYRKNTSHGTSIETVTHSKQQKLIRAAQQYLQKHPTYQHFLCRFDVVGVESDLKYPTITWIQSAFER